MTQVLDLGPNAAFIWAAYGAVVLVLSLLIAWIVIDARRQRQMLEALEAKGITRRSAARGQVAEDTDER